MVLSVLHSKNKFIFSSTGRRPASLCHGRCPSCVRMSVRPSVRTYEPDIVGLGLG